MFVARSGSLAERSSPFEVIHTTGSSQVATMVLSPGESAGAYGTEHPQSDQALLVVAGKARAVVEGKEEALGAGDFLLIEAGERHSVLNCGEATLVMLTWYAPPAYDDQGDPL